MTEHCRATKHPFAICCIVSSCDPFALFQHLSLLFAAFPPVATRREAHPEGPHHDNNEAGNRTAMNQVEPYDADDAVEAMQALHCALTDDLEALEAQILALGRATASVPADDSQQMAEYYEARTALYSGLASIAEVLAWIQLKTEEDPEGDVARAIVPLPTLRGRSIH